jgi:hypothetical protein
MRKKLLFLVALAAGFGSLHAQTSGGPDNFGYVWRNSLDANGPAYNWVEIDGLPETVEVTGLTDDNVIGPIALPVPFHYYWYDVNNFYVGSNGYIAFQNANIASGTNGFPVIPTPDTKNDIVAAFMTDLLYTTPTTPPGLPPNPGRCYYYISPAHDSLIVTYDSVPFWDNAAGYLGVNTFQIILNYSDSSIVMNYKEQVGASAGAVGWISTGIENNSGNIGLQNLYEVYPAAGTAVKYYYPQVITLAINDASTIYNDNTGNGAVFLSKDGAPYTMVTEVQNTGNQPLPSFNVSSQIRRVSNNALIVGDTAATSALNPGQSEVVTQQSTFNPTVAGAFLFRTDTQLAGDLTPSNNRKEIEVEVIDTAQLTIEMEYENATVNTGTVSWTGGDGGSAVYMKPPYAPYTISAVKAFVAADANNFGYYMMVFADDGANGAPGTLLDSQFVAPGTFTIGTYTTTTLTTPLVRPGGGFYLLWYMGGDGVALGTVITPPISNQTYEVLVGATAANFAAYRERQTEDLMLRAVLAGTVNVQETKSNLMFGNLYPNPASTDNVYLDYDLKNSNTNEFNINIYDAEGRLLSSQLMNGTNGTLSIDARNLNSGFYMCKINIGNETISRNFSIVK